MNENLKYGLIFLGGLAVGALGAAAASRKSAVKPLAADILSRGMDAKDAMLGKVETVKEGLEDMLAEARHAAERRREKREEKRAEKHDAAETAEASEASDTAKQSSTS